MLRFLVDENFDNDILRGVLRRNPEADIARVQDVGLRGADDPAILEWAASENLVLLTHDVETMTYYAYERVKKGLPMPGVFEVSQNAAIGEVIEDILLLLECSLPNEWVGQVRYLPLR